MSYAIMDHAEWVENYNAAINKQLAHRQSFRPRPEKLSDFQKKVCDILGIVFGGIYNAPINWEKGVTWTFGGIGVFVKFSMPKDLATYDHDELTKLVFLCHEARIRCQTELGRGGSLGLAFFPREAEGGVSKRHPNLDEAVADFRRWMPKDHRIFYKPERRGKTYVGERTSQGYQVHVFGTDGVVRELPLRLDLFNHSPTGFAWGYGGSGPAQLALAILADYLGDDTLALDLHQPFKSEVIAKLDDVRWELPEIAVRQKVDELKARSESHVK